MANVFDSANRGSFLVTPATIERESRYAEDVALLRSMLAAQLEAGEITAYEVHAHDNFYMVTDDEDGTMTFPIHAHGYSDSIDDGDDQSMPF